MFFAKVAPLALLAFAATSYAAPSPQQDDQPYQGPGTDGCQQLVVELQAIFQSACPTKDPLYAEDNSGSDSGSGSGSSSNSHGSVTDPNQISQDTIAEVIQVIAQYAETCPDIKPPTYQAGYPQK